MIQCCQISLVHDGSSEVHVQDRWGCGPKLGSHLARQEALHCCLLSPVESHLNSCCVTFESVFCNSSSN